MRARPTIVMPLFVLSLALPLSCTDTQPCTDCPPVEGVWFLQYFAPDFPCDGGTPSAPPMTVGLMRQGSVLHSAIDGVELTGTLYDTYDLSLNGALPGGGETVSMRARYQAASTADAGNDQLLDGRLAREIGGCRDERRFTGARY